MYRFSGVILMLLVSFMLTGCFGHSVETSGDEYLREYGDLDIENDRGIQNINIYLTASSSNETSSEQKVGADQKSEADANLGWNGGAVSAGADSVATGLQTLDYLIKAGGDDAVAPPTVLPPVITPPVEPVEPKPPIGSVIEKLDYHKRTNGQGDGSGDDPLDRPTWYGSKLLKDYPDIIRVFISGCTDQVVNISGTRPNGTPGYEDKNLIVKQSDVSGRGLSILFSNSCMSKDASLEY